MRSTHDPQHVIQQRSRSDFRAGTRSLRAELEHFARAARAKRPLAVAGGDEFHGVEIFESILRSAKSGKTARIGAKKA